jgi:hypothetical protein
MTVIAVQRKYSLRELVYSAALGFTQLLRAAFLLVCDSHTKVEVALRDPHAFEKHTHRPNFSGDKSSSSSGDGGDGNSGGGLRVLPVFVLSDLAFSSPLIGGDGKAAPLAFDHGHLVRVKNEKRERTLRSELSVDSSVIVLIAIGTCIILQCMLHTLAFSFS